MILLFSFQPRVYVKGTTALSLSDNNDYCQSSSYQRANRPRPSAPRLRCSRPPPRTKIPQLESNNPRLASLLDWTLTATKSPSAIADVTFSDNVAWFPIVAMSGWTASDPGSITDNSLGCRSISSSGIWKRSAHPPLHCSSTSATPIMLSVFILLRSIASPCIIGIHGRVRRCGSEARCARARSHASHRISVSAQHPMLTACSGHFALSNNQRALLSHTPATTAIASFRRRCPTLALQPRISATARHLLCF